MHVVERRGRVVAVRVDDVDAGPVSARDLVERQVSDRRGEMQRLRAAARRLLIR